MRTVAFIQGGGVGYDQETSVRAVFEALRVPVQFDRQLAGLAAAEAGSSIGLSGDCLKAVKTHGVALKTKLITAPDAKIQTNLNVAFRRALGLYASVRPVHNLAGLPSRFSGVNFLLVREITEDLYSTGEYEVVPGVVQSFKVATAQAAMKFFRFAFQLAKVFNRKTVHCIHKANILKMSDGLYLECFRRVATEFGEIAAKEMIVDNACMQMVSKPQQFDVVACGNMYGDLLSDLGAGLVGGISATAAINMGDNMAVYEAVYGATHTNVKPGTANPLPLLMPAAELLKGIEEKPAAERLLKAIEAVLVEGRVKPSDLGGTATTVEFTNAVISKL